MWRNYRQTSMERLRAAYNNAYRIMHYMPRNESVRPPQVNQRVRTFDVLLRNNLYLTFLSDCSKRLMLFINFAFPLLT